MNATDPMAAIGHYINAFNSGDGEGMAASSLSPAQSLTAWHRTCGTGQQPLKIGTETC